MTQIETYELPEHWACALLYDDKTGLPGDDYKALNNFENDLVKRHVWFSCVDVDIQAGNFTRYHDARQYGILACNTAIYSFIVGG